MLRARLDLTPAGRARRRCRRASRSRPLLAELGAEGAGLSSDRVPVGDAANAALEGDPSPELQERWQRWRDAVALRREAAEAS